MLLGHYLRFLFYQNWTRLLSERTVSSSITILSLAKSWMTAMYFFLHFKVQVTSQDLCIVIKANSRVHLDDKGTSNG